MIKRPAVAIPLALALLVVSGWAVAAFPRSILAFLLFQASILFIYLAAMPGWLRGALLAMALLVMMPLIGASNVYYLEIATQVGIFAALALGLNIVVGLAGLLDLGYVAFFAAGAYVAGWLASQQFGGSLHSPRSWIFGVYEGQVIFVEKEGMNEFIAKSPQCGAAKPSPSNN